MSEESDFNASIAQRLMDTRAALRDGKLKVAPALQPRADELINAPLTLTGLVDTSGLSQEAIALGRSAALGLIHFESTQEKPSTPALSIAEGQQELFSLFRQLFSALTGCAVELIGSQGEIRNLMMWRVQHEHEAMASAVNSVAEELAAFYNAHAVTLFKQAKTFGGMRLVTGGQRSFGPSALNGVRITGLYADTQLIPDPVHPFLASDLHLNAKELQLAHALYYILQLRPLVDAALPVPPVFVFPSFEEGLEKNDAYTIQGMEQQALRLLSPLCDASIASIEELFDYAKRKDNAFAHALLAEGLFIPPGGEPGQNLGVKEASDIYLAELRGIRSAEIVKSMAAMPTGVLLLMGVLERLRPNYHLLENASELGAQPLLSQRVHWHYFEKCAQTNAQELRRKEVLSEQAFHTLRAVQDESLSWLANIPVQTLTELIVNNEHRWLRDELNKYTSQLSSLGAINTNEMVREVSYGLASIVQRQQKAMADIEKKYAPKKMAAAVGGGAGLSVVAAAILLPALSPLLGVAVPAVAAVAAIGGGVMAFGKEKAGELVEKKQAESSMIGVLATARSIAHPI